MYNPRADLLYDAEHGDLTDDEVNLLEKGMNYGWINVRGYHNGNYKGEMDYVNNYIANPAIAGDKLTEPLYSWCNVPQPSDTTYYLNLCTVAPSDGIYYGNDVIEEWDNSLLVVTLKNGLNTDHQLFQFNLSADGRTLLPSTVENPNPKTFFTGDQGINGRLRDITMSPDGTTFYLISNDFYIPHKIIIYKYNKPTGLSSDGNEGDTFHIYPNPGNDGIFNFSQPGDYVILDQTGKEVMNGKGSFVQISHLPKGVYYLKSGIDGAFKIKQLIYN